MGNGDRRTGGVSLVSKFKVTNLVPVKDEKLTAVHMYFYQSNWNCADSQGLSIRAPQLSRGHFTVLLAWDAAVLSSPNSSREKSEFRQ